MEKFKKRWEIQHNWQLLFPILGLLALIYSSFKLSKLFSDNIYIIVCQTIIVTAVLLKFILFLFKKLEAKWKVDYKWEMIRIFIVFAITGSSSVFIGKPIINWLGITKENLVFFGWLFGQHKFFWEFEKKMLRRFGLGKFFN